LSSDRHFDQNARSRSPSAILELRCAIIAVDVPARTGERRRTPSPTTTREWLVIAERGDLRRLKKMYAATPALLDALGTGPYWTGKARALHFATYRGHRSVVRWLLDRGSSPNAVTGEFDWAPIHFACLPLRRSLYNLLVGRGARPDIFTAALRGDVREVRRLLRERPRLVSTLGPDGATPLHFAATPAVARALLSAGADPRRRDRYHGSTPIEWTLERPGVPQVIARAGGGMTIFAAAAIGDRNTVRALLQRNPRLLHARVGQDRGFGGNGETPLGIAARFGRRAVVALLLAHGAPATTTPSPLPGAVSKGDAAIVRRLLAAGADPNAFGPYGSAALHAACMQGKLPMIRLLLSRGARLDLRDREHHGTPLGWAQYFRHPAAARLLRIAARSRVR
jgi:ankyrin repeat protein